VHGHAVERDLLAMGYRMTDVGDTLTLGELVSIVLASPPNSAVRYATERGWSQADLLLAQHNEQAFGIHYDRPGAKEDTPDLGGVIPGGGGRYVVHTIDEFKAHRARVAEHAAELAATEKSLA
jgi:hypothetical protein